MSSELEGLFREAHTLLKTARNLIEANSLTYRLLGKQ
jgi:hypothetical protein